MDQQTKQALKHDQFVDTTAHGLEWASENRRSLIVTGSIVLALIVIAVGSIYVLGEWQRRAYQAFASAPTVRLTAQEAGDNLVGKDWYAPT